VPRKPKEHRVSRLVSTKGGVSEVRVSDEMHAISWLEIGPDAPDDVAAAHLGKLNQMSFSDFTDKLRAELNAQLLALGWPPGDRNVSVKDDTWELYDGEVPPRPFSIRIELGSAYVLARCEKFSPAWFLAKISEELLAVERGSPASRDWAIFMLARRIESREHRVLRKKVQNGAGIERNPSAGGKQKALITKPRTEATRAEMQRLIGKGKTIAAAARIAHQNGLGTSPGANARLWHPRRK
jgi:hypothetical protein